MQCCFTFDFFIQFLYIKTTVRYLSNLKRAVYFICIFVFIGAVACSLIISYFIYFYLTVIFFSLNIAQHITNHSET